MAKTRTNLINVVKMLIEDKNTHKYQADVQYSEDAGVVLKIYDENDKQVASASFGKSVVLVDNKDKKVATGRYKLKGVRFDIPAEVPDSPIAVAAKRAARVMGSSPIAMTRHRSV